MVRGKLIAAMCDQIQELRKQAATEKGLSPCGQCVKCKVQKRTHFYNNCGHLAYCGGCIKTEDKCPFCGVYSNSKKLYLPG